jgi:hypothetical protein
MSGAQMPQKSPPMAPIRDPDLAVAEELELARQAHTVAAYDLFLARHPNHPLAATARQERDRIPFTSDREDFQTKPPDRRNPYRR